MKFELDLSKYAAKSDLEKATGVGTSGVAQKTDLASLKSDLDKLDSDKLENVSSGLNNLKSDIDKLDADEWVSAPACLSKPSDVVKHDVVKELNIISYFKTLITLVLLMLVI